MVNQVVPELGKCEFLVDDPIVSTEDVSQSERRSQCNTLWFTFFVLLSVLIFDAYLRALNGSR